MHSPIVSRQHKRGDCVAVDIAPGVRVEGVLKDWQSRETALVEVEPAYRSLSGRTVVSAKTNKEQEG